MLLYVISIINKSRANPQFLLVGSLANMKIKKQIKRNGFTLVELLVVIAIIVALASVAIWGVTGALRKARFTETLNMCTGLVNGVENFYSDHNYLPIQGAGGGGEFLEGDTASGEGVTMIQALTNREPGAGGPGGAANRLNTKAVDYFNARITDARSNGLFMNGNQIVGLFDPFGNPIQFRLDSNYTNRIPEPFGQQIIAGRMLAWSLGPSNDPQIVTDHVYSWKNR